jgi:hypothetical protein
MLNKLKSILPEKKETYKKTNIITEPDKAFQNHQNIGYNQALTEIEALLPDMLALIREEIEGEKSNYPFCDDTADWRRGYTEAIDDILNILK